MKIHSAKSHILSLGNDIGNANNVITSENNNQLFSFRHKPLFSRSHKEPLKNGNEKLNALARIASCMYLEKRKTEMKAFVTFQFGYCSFIWMFHSRGLNNKINSFHKQALGITYGGKSSSPSSSSSSQHLLKKENSSSVHHTNIQVVANKIMKELKL